VGGHILECVAGGEDIEKEGGVKSRVTHGCTSVNVNVAGGERNNHWRAVCIERCPYGSGKDF
jgi:hypothetical protein